MDKVVAYCGFLNHSTLTVPEAGVNGSAVHVLSDQSFRLLWSEVSWPFDPKSMQRNALEFHRVIHQIFSQRAVIPFRLLSIFENKDEVQRLVHHYRDEFVLDLQRLADYVQMECVAYFVLQRQDAENSSGARYLQQRATLWRNLEDYSDRVAGALGAISRGLRVREVNSGRRLFVLIDRGREKEYRETIEKVELAAGIRCRTSGPWPAAEFLSDAVKAPQIAGKL